MRIITICIQRENFNMKVKLKLIAMISDKCNESENFLGPT